MSTTVTESVASTGAPVPTLDDDVISVITGITLLDCNAELIAQRFRARSWAQRTNFFNNIICGSLARQARMLDYAKTKDDGVAFLEWGMTEMMRRIGQVLDLWGETEPADADAAALFSLSLNPRHRRAAQSWTKGDQQFFDTYVQENWLALAAFFNLCAMSDICAASAWRAGPVEPGDWFEIPGWTA